MTLVKSAASGDRLAALRDLRDVLASSIAHCESLRDLAALSGRLQSVLEEISKLEPAKAVGDGIDEIASRRTARRGSTAKGSGRSERTS